MRTAWSTSAVLLLLAPVAAGQADPSPPPEPEIPLVRALRTAGLKAEVAALIMSGQQGGALPIEVLALPVRSEDDKVRVPVLIEIAGQPLLDARGDGPLRFEIYAYALAESGGLQDSLMQTFEVDPEHLVHPLEEGGFRFSGDLDLLPGEHSLRILVRQADSQDVLGIRTLPLTVPAAEGERPILLLPLIAGGEGRWLELREAKEKSAPAREPLPMLAQTPAAKPLLTVAEEISLRVPAFHLAAVGSELTIEVLGRDDQTIELPARVSSYSPAAETGLPVLTATFQPNGLRAGDYRLRVILPDAQGERVDSPLLPVRFVEHAEGLVWAAATVSNGGPGSPGGIAAPQAGTSAAGPMAATRDTRKKDAPLVAKTYAGILRSLANGDERGARASLLDFSQSLARDHGADGLDLLARTEVAVWLDLVKIEPEALAPVTMLHHWLYEEARHRGIGLLSTHARTGTLRLVEITLENPTYISQKRSAKVLASLGSILQRSNMMRFSEGVFKRALHFGPRNEIALLGLAFNHEKIGDWERAVEYLSALVDAHPQHGEGRLRLAVNLRRLERTKAAQRQLEEILAGEHRRWVLSLACQELARHHTARGDFEEAEKILAAGIERLPGSQKLYLELAFLHEAQARPDEVRATLDAMSLRELSNTETPRRRYASWPTRGLAETRQALRAEAASLTGELAAALAASRWVQETG